MEVNIKVSENAGGATVTGLSNTTAPAAGHTDNDGGAPGAQQAAGGQTAGAGTLQDMGGPPQWLKDAIGGSHNQAVSIAAGNSSGSDAGAAPSFG